MSTIVIKIGGGEGIEPTADERVVERADRQQARAEQAVRQAQRGEHDEVADHGIPADDMCMRRWPQLQQQRCQDWNYPCSPWVY